MSHAVPFLVSLATGALAILALPRFDVGFLAWVGIAPLLWTLKRQGAVRGGVLGLIFGYVFGAGTFAWLNGVAGVTPFRFSILVLAFSLYYAVFGSLYAVAARPLGRWMIVAAPALWVALEYLRSNLGVFALPWNLLAHSQYRYLAVIQLADLTGVYGISFVLLVTNELLSQSPELARKRRLLLRQGLAVGLMITVFLIYGWYQLRAIPAAAGERFRIALVQANVVPRSDMTSKERMVQLGAYGRLTMNAKTHDPALIVWPSSSLPAPLSFWMVRVPVNFFAQKAGVPLLIGGAGGEKFATPEPGQRRYSNSEFLISPSGQIEAQYNKIHLTPFTEYVPLNGTIVWPRWITTLDKSFVRGDTYTLFQVGAARFGTPICWENAFPDVFRRFVRDGANLMVSVTNEGLFGETSAPHQTLAMNVFRAVENRVAVARSATTGVSAFIGPTGAILSRVQDATGRDTFVSGILVADVPLSSRKTFYTMHGDVFAQAVTGGALIVVVMALVHRRRAVGESRRSWAARSPETTSG
jgi:apolipoprotein N-acyltransferase